MGIKNSLFAFGRKKQQNEFYQQDSSFLKVEKGDSQELRLYVKSHQLVKCLFLRKLGKKPNARKETILFSKIPLLMSKFEIYPKLSYQLKLVHINRGTNKVFVYDFGKNECYTVETDRRIPTDSNNLFYHLNFYVIGGLVKGSQSKEVYKYNLKGQSQQLPSLLKERSQCALCVLQRNMYVIGGVQERSVERLSLQNPVQWQQISHLNKKRKAAFASSTGHRIYVFGGESDIEFYEPETDL